MRGMVRAPLMQPRCAMNATQNNTVFTGLVTIGALFGRSRWTVKRWIKTEGFPAGQLPDGTHATTLPLISEWVLERARKSEGNGHA